MVRITVKKLTQGSNAGRYAVRQNGKTVVHFADKQSAERFAKSRRKIFK